MVLIFQRTHSYQHVADILESVDNYRFRIALWTCGRGAYRFDDRVPVTIVFTQPNEIAEHVVTNLIFTHLYDDEEYDVPRRDEEGVCWFFLKAYWLLTDWQNITREIERELEEAVRLNLCVHLLSPKASLYSAGAQQSRSDLSREASDENHAPPGRSNIRAEGIPSLPLQILQETGQAEGHHAQVRRRRHRSCMG